MKTIKLPLKLNQGVLSFGSQAKNTVCFAKDFQATISEPLADLREQDDFNKFKRRIKILLRRKPRVFACDLHPEYLSSGFARSIPSCARRLYAVQHHHAHLVSCMAENRLKKGRVIGVACDGTGMGDDGKLWGFEFFVLNYKGYLRVGHLQYIPLIGGEAAIREPYRVALACLYSVFGAKFMELKLELMKEIKKTQWKIFELMINKGINCPLSSSAGRLFDAVSSLLGLKHRIDFEAEAAIALEDAASSYSSLVRNSGYRFNVFKKENKFVIDSAPMFREIVKDLLGDKPRNLIARKFHFTVALMILQICRKIERESSLRSVVLSGGVFQNRILSKDVVSILKDAGFKVITHKILPPNDSCISLGQAVVAGMNK